MDQVGSAQGARAVVASGRRSLFIGAQTVGAFRGFSNGGLEFHANLSLPYRSNFQSLPIHGQFIMVRLETDEEAILGRIIYVSADNAGNVAQIQPATGEPAEPEVSKRIRYTVDIRLLGVLRSTDTGVVFAASHRRLPHVGSPVAFLSDELLREVAGHNAVGAEIGYLAMGEFVYAEGDARIKPEKYPWMQVVGPAVMPKFNAMHMVARKTVCLAKAGMGKSNTIKLLFSTLYSGTPTVPRRDGRKVPVGSILFDPEGEYFWPDPEGRPGFCDVPGMADKVVVFTDRDPPSPYYGSFVACGVKIDIRTLKPADVIAVAIPEDKQDQANVKKMKGMSDSEWRSLVDETYVKGYRADEDLFMKVLHLKDAQESEMLAARAHMVQMVRMIHSPGSPTLDMLFLALSEGKLCVVDLSRMRGTPSLTLSGLMLQRLFAHNQEEHTKANSKAIPVVTVVEEAQAVLGAKGSSGEGPYIEWVKEGRKYGLGSVLITQQPGNIPNEILSQSDNFFIFHLLSAGDLQAVKKANAHFSDDILSSLLNEPLHGHGVFWSSALGKSYPIPIRTLLFEEMYPPVDRGYCLPFVSVYGSRIRARFAERIDAQRALEEAAHEAGEAVDPVESQEFAPPHDAVRDREDRLSDAGGDPVDAELKKAVGAVRSDGNLVRDAMKPDGVPWGRIRGAIEMVLPSDLPDRGSRAHSLVPRALDEVFGRGQWTSEKRPRKRGTGETSYVFADKPKGKKAGK